MSSRRTKHVFQPDDYGSLLHDDADEERSVRQRNSSDEEVSASQASIYITEEELDDMENVNIAAFIRMKPVTIRFTRAGGRTVGMEAS
ncbi:hypothetical protein CF326_g9317 [Tilletia indica]|nr:hypothetical protein CF326_g9317 [Tilletia indica]